MKQKKQSSVPFTGYQKFAIFILALTMFTVVLDFMVMSPLGDILMKSLGLKPSHFGFAVSAYAFSAGISGLLTAGFAYRYDRKKLLLFFTLVLLPAPSCVVLPIPIRCSWEPGSLRVCSAELSVRYRWPSWLIYLICNTGAV